MTCLSLTDASWHGCCRWIQSVYVPEHFRQQGHFKSLYKHVRQEAQKAGAAGLRLYADVGNERAHTAVGVLAAAAPADSKNAEAATVLRPLLLLSQYCYSVVLYTKCGGLVMGRTMCTAAALHGFSFLSAASIT